MRIKFIVNPSAGGGRVGRRLGALERAAREKLGTFDLILTKNSEDIKAQTRRALHSGYAYLGVVGGDGTLNAVINGYFEGENPINPQVPILVTPWGTGSDFYRSVSSGTKRSWLDWFSDHVVKSVDVCRLETLRTSNKRWFMNMASFGLGAEVVHKRSGLPKSLPSAVAYALPAVTSLITPKTYSLVIKMNGDELRMDAFTVFVAKGMFAGGGMRLGLSTKRDDGLVSVTVVRPLTPLQRLTRFGKLYSGNFSNDPCFHQERTEAIEIRSVTGPIPIETDGEWVGVDEARITVRPRCVPLCFPREKA